METTENTKIWRLLTDVRLDRRLHSWHEYYISEIDAKQHISKRESSREKSDREGKERVMYQVIQFS